MPPKWRKIKVRASVCSVICALSESTGPSFVVVNQHHRGITSDTPTVLPAVPRRRVPRLDLVAPLHLRHDAELFLRDASHGLLATSTQQRTRDPSPATCPLKTDA
jgi:hypothetical protein